MTLPKACIDIGKSERIAGVSQFICCYQQSKNTCILCHWTYNVRTINQLETLANSQYRLEEENRLFTARIMICKVKIYHNNAPFVISEKYPPVLNAPGIKQVDLKRNTPFTLSLSGVLDEGPTNPPTPKFAWVTPAQYTLAKLHLLG